MHPGSVERCGGRWPAHFLTQQGLRQSSSCGCFQHLDARSEILDRVAKLCEELVGINAPCVGVDRGEELGLLGLEGPHLGEE